MLTIRATLAELERALVDDQSALRCHPARPRTAVPVRRGPVQRRTRLTPPPPDQKASSPCSRSTGRP